MKKIAEAFRKLLTRLEGLLLGRPNTLILLACIAFDKSGRGFND